MRTKSRTLGVAVAGLGVGEAHARAFAASGCRVLWLYDLAPQKAKGLSGSLDGARAARDFDAILDDPEVSIVSIASYDDAHFGQALAALKAGKHVFVEKPLCRSRLELKTLHAARRKSGRHLASNLALRGAPLFRWLDEAISSGRLGELYAFDGDYLYGRLEKIVGGWRKDVTDYSVMQGGGIHLVDLMLGLSGQKPEAVMAAGGRISTRGTAFRYDDFAAATFRFKSGLVGRVTANFGCVHPHQHVVRVFGTKGSFILDDRDARLHWGRDGSPRVETLNIAAQPADKGVLIPDFVRGILEGRDPEPQARREFEAVAVCLAADAAREGGAWVPVEYP